MNDFNLFKTIFGYDILQDYIDNKPFKCFKGPIYLQTREPIHSTESRLVVDKYDEFIEYDLSEYEDKFYYYNNVTRTLQSFQNPASSRNLAFDHCSDCAIEYDIFEKYLKSKNNVFKYYDLIKEIRNQVYKLTKLTRHSLSEKGHGMNFPN
jgi:hypothetical protein